MFFVRSSIAGAACRNHVDLHEVPEGSCVTVMSLLFVFCQHETWFYECTSASLQAGFLYSSLMPRTSLVRVQTPARLPPMR